MIHTTDQIARLHQKIEQRFGRHFPDTDLSIKCLEKWQAMPGGRFHFSIVSDLDEFAERERGERCQVLKVPGFDPLQGAVWVGWYEQWEIRGTISDRTRFCLIGASLTFYWGYGGREKRTMLRAEWDQIDERARSAPQPHWHVGRDLVLDVNVPARVFRAIDETAALTADDDGASGDLVELSTPNSSPDLEELRSADGLQELVVQGMHLGMGWWKNATTHPDCWQRSLQDSSVLVDWVDNTLASAIHQFGNARTFMPLPPVI